MASFTPSPILNSLMLLFLLCFLWSGSAPKVEGTRKCDLASFLDFKGNEKVAYLPLVHKDAPCSLYLQGSQGENGSDSDSEILGQDEKRENLIKSLPKKCKDIKNLKYNGASYLVQVTLDGQKPWLSFDTGSVLTWTKADKSCLTTKPCKCLSKGSTLYKQESQCVNDACKGSGGVKMGCSEMECPTPPAPPPPAPGHDDPSVQGFKQQYNHSEEAKCHYLIRYGTEEQSECSSGFLGNAALDLGGDKNKYILVGCANIKKDQFEQEDGILGLGNDSKLSIVSQIKETYGEKFSYCIPPDEKSTGFLRFGHHESDGKNAHKHDMVVDEDLIYYKLKLEIIKVGPYTTRPFQGFVNVVVDSGNTYTKLPKELFDKVLEKYRFLMEGYEKVEERSAKPQGLEEFPACYKTREQFKIPDIKFKFDNHPVLLPSNGITVQKDGSSNGEKYACLAFFEDKRDHVIWGSYQQKGIQINIDIEENKIWFDDGQNNSPGGNSMSI